MPSGMVTKLEFFFYYYFFFATQIVYRESKTAYIKEIILYKGNSRLNIIQNIHTFQARINEFQTTPRIC